MADAHLPHLDGLIRRGCQLRATLAADARSPSAIPAIRLWQQDCAGAIHHLSGGSKAHWLARAYSEAFLLRSAPGRLVAEAPLGEIVDRIVGVLEQAVGAMSRVRDADEGTGVPGAAPPAHRFDFVHNAELRPILEQAYADGRRALDERRFSQALLTVCGILEAIVTDALEHLERRGSIAHLSFEARLAAAERAGLLHGGCARLPPIARRYRDVTDAGGELGAGITIVERDARRAGQVLRVVMRDLDPGR